jgi:hypothetical protein
MRKYRAALKCKYRLWGGITPPVLRVNVLVFVGLAPAEWTWDRDDVLVLMTHAGFGGNPISPNNQSPCQIE